MSVDSLAGHLDLRQFGTSRGTDNTQQITDAVQAAADNQRKLIISPRPDGTAWIYDGPGIDYAGIGDWLSLEASSPRGESTLIDIRSNAYLIDISDANFGQKLENIHTRGGKGVLRDRTTTALGYGRHMFIDITARDFTEAAITNNALDQPHWYIDRCEFIGNDAEFGIALSSRVNSSCISATRITGPMCAIKLVGADDVSITGATSMYNNNANTPGNRKRCKLWVVPQRQPELGDGLWVTGTKFGNENWGPNDYQIAYLDELAGATNAERLPDWDTQAVGAVVGVNITGIKMAWTGALPGPMIYTRLPRNNWSGVSIHSNSLRGADPTHIVEFDSIAPPPGPHIDAEMISMQAGDGFEYISFPPDGGGNAAWVTG